MLTEEIRTRLSMLVRRPAVQRASQWVQPASDLASLAPGEVVRESVGEFYRIRQPVSVSVNREGFERPGLFGDEFLNDAAEHPELGTFELAYPSRVLYMDLETCGFSGAPLFLVGLLRYLDGKPVVEQLLARDYSEEAAVLAHFWKLLPQYDVLVTFNGKSFDWPFMRDRSTALRLQSQMAGDQRGPGEPACGGHRQLHDSNPLGPAPTAHLDVLHFARRRWKKAFRLPNCRLQTLEAVLCRRRRYGDIPGHMISEVYHSFIRNGDARRLQQVLQHNLVDLVTLAQLSLFLLAKPAPVE